MKKILIVFLCVLFLSGCEFFEEETNNQLATPENLRYIDQYIIFDAVEHADRYRIQINDEIMITTYTAYAFSEPGEYVVIVEALGEGYETSASAYLNIFNPYPLTAPNNLMLIGNILSFDEVPNAYRYEIDFDYRGKIYTTDSIVDISGYILLYGSYLTIKVRAQFNHGLSNYSETLEVIEGKPIIKKMVFNYSKVSSSDLVIFSNIDQLSVRSVKVLNTDEFLAQDYYLVGDEFAMKATYFDTLDAGSYYYTIQTHRGYVQLIVHVNETNLPYLINTSDIYVDFSKNLTFEFDLMGGEIVSLTAKNLKETDYTIHGHLATINLDYLTTIFSEYGRVDLIVRYELKLDHETVIGYIKLTDNT